MSWDYIPPAPPLHPRQRPAQEVVHVDYKDVLRQAVENERFRVLREVRKALGALPTEGEVNRSTYSRDPIPAARFRREAYEALDRIEKED